MTLQSCKDRCVDCCIKNISNATVVNICILSACVSLCRSEWSKGHSRRNWYTGTSWIQRHRWTERRQGKSWWTRYWAPRTARRKGNPLVITIVTFYNTSSMNRYFYCGSVNLTAHHVCTNNWQLEHLQSWFLYKESKVQEYVHGNSGD